MRLRNREVLSVCIAFLAPAAAFAEDSKSQAVTLTGEVVDAACYMIPVGEKNKLSVRVEGGYKVLTLASREA